MGTADLYAFFAALPGDDRATTIDTFAALCWMHHQGKQQPAIKLMRDLLNQANRQLDEDHQELVTWILDNLPGNQKTFAQAVPARSEFRQLFAEK